MGYTAGTLDLSILGASDSAVASIDKTVKSLNSLSRSISKIQKINFGQSVAKISRALSVLSASTKGVDTSAIAQAGKSINTLAKSIVNLNSTSTVFATQQLSNLFEKLSISVNKISPDSLKSISSLGRSIGSISKIGNLLSVDWKKIDWNEIRNGFNQLTYAMTPLIDKVSQAQSGLVALYEVIQKAPTNKIQEIGSLLSGGSFLGKIGGFLWKGVKFVGKTVWNVGTGLFKGAINLFKKPVDSFGKLLKISAWTGAIYAVKRIGSAVANIAKNGADFSETLNLWQVAMGEDLIPQATEFVNKLNEAYGISKKTLMNSQAIFKNMLGSLGELTSEQAYALSKGITQMALDYASLYNVKFEDAMTKFQAALAGQVRPIRSVAGYDITENTLFQLYQTLGGTKTMRQLSRTEKQLLAIYAVFEQMDRSGAIGDLERTINSFANQSRVMADSWKEVLTYAGLATTRLLETWGVMKYVNAGLIFLSRILEGLATSLDTGLGNSGEVFGDMESGVIDTTEAVEDLHSALLDFDKFRALDKTDTVTETLGIDETILNAISRYEIILQDATLESRKMADTWLQSLGFIDEATGEVTNLEQGVDNIFNKIKNIDWTELVNRLSSAIKNAIDKGIEWFGNQDWGKIGQDIANFVKDAKWGETIASAIDLFGSILNAGIDIVNNFVTETEWEDEGNSFGNLFKKLLDTIVLAFQKVKWEEIGASIGAFIKNSRFLEALFTALDLAADIANGLVSILTQAISSADWDSLGKEFDSMVDSYFKDSHPVLWGLLKFGAWVFDALEWAGNSLYRAMDLPPPNAKLPPGEAILGSNLAPEDRPSSYSFTPTSFEYSNSYNGIIGTQTTTQIAQATYSGTMQALNDWWGGSSAKSDIPQLKEANPTGMYQAVTGVAKQYGKGWAKV